MELKLVTNLSEPLFTVAHIEDSMIIACLESEDADVELLRQHIKARWKEQHFMTKEAVKQITVLNMQARSCGVWQATGE